MRNYVTHMLVWYSDHPSCKMCHIQPQRPLYNRDGKIMSPLDFSTDMRKVTMDLMAQEVCQEINCMPAVEAIWYMVDKGSLMGPHKDGSNCKLGSSICTWTEGDTTILKITLNNGTQLEIPNGGNLLYKIISGNSKKVYLLF